MDLNASRPMAPAPRQQRGAVLITSMVLLLIMTMLGITVMNTSNLEEQMAANASYHNRAFQAAESALDQAFNGINTATVAGIMGTVNNYPAPPSGLGTGLGGTATVRYVGPMPALGQSVGQGTQSFAGRQGGGLLATSHRLRITATGSLDDGGGNTLSRVRIIAGARFQ